MIMTLWFKTSSSKEEEKEPKVKRAQEESCTMCLSLELLKSQPLEVINSYEGLGIPLYPPPSHNCCLLGYFASSSFFFSIHESLMISKPSPSMLLSMMNHIHGLFRNRSSILPLVLSCIHDSSSISLVRMPHSFSVILHMFFSFPRRLGET